MHSFLKIQFQIFMIINDRMPYYNDDVHFPAFEFSVSYNSGITVILIMLTKFLLYTGV